jgi:hypothetical protein
MSNEGPPEVIKADFYGISNLVSLGFLLLSPFLSDYLEGKEFREIVSSTCEGKIHFVIISFSHPCKQQHLPLFYFIFP